MGGEPAAQYLPDGEAATPDILVVCTANIARSPLLAAWLRAEADLRAGTGAMVIDSAGTDAGYGDPVAEGSRRVAAGWGLDLTGHASKSVVYVPLEHIPLKIVMTRGHFRALSARNPAWAASTFTALDLQACIEHLRATEQLPPAPPQPTDRAVLQAHLHEVVGRAAEVRPRRRWWRPTINDIRDPIGKDGSVYDQLGERLVSVGEVLAEALFGPRPR